MVSVAPIKIVFVGDDNHRRQEKGHTTFLFDLGTFPYASEVRA